MALMVDLRYTGTHKRDFMKHPFEEINAAPMMALNNRATSGDAREFIAELTELIAAKEHRNRQRKAADQKAFELALELIIGDLFSNYREDAAGWVYRSIHRPSFTGELVGHTTFTNSITLLEQAGLIERWQGGNIKNPFHNENTNEAFHPGLASRFRATNKLIELAAAANLTFANAKSHFLTELPRQTLHLKATKKVLSAGRKDAGRALKFAANAQTTALKEQVQNVNTYLIEHELVGGLFAGYIRRFSEGDHKDFNWDRGGRLYAVGSDSYQLMKKAQRLQMHINGSPIAEIDISASYLTMLHALLGVPLPPTDDLYDIEGLPRDIVKAFVTAAIGNNKFHARWPAKLSQELKKQGFDLSKTPMRLVQTKVCKALPVLAAWEQQPISWSRLMFMESEQMLSTMEELRDTYDIPSYSVHDSIIIPASKLELCASVMKEKFESRFGVKYSLKAHLSDGQMLAF